MPAPLDELDAAARAQVLAAGRRRRFGKREVIFHEGDPGDTVHFVESGRLVARVTTPRGDVATLSVIGPGQTFGELALLDPAARRTATVIALEPTATVALDRTQLHEIGVSHPAVERLITSMVVGYAQRLSQLYLEALYLPAERRVARRLVQLADIYGGSDIGLTQDDIAAIAGTSRATVNRVLGQLSGGGAISVARGRITVVDRAAVERAGR